ncbi:phosphorylase family protein [Bacteroides fragilis]|uniref:phosphorylase family protein n=1 Tax=Bacteroides fragilis TaxID=817 RepID=UPI00101CB8D2|nr:hypothetical protein [Bacteroides fragilis]
MNIYTQKPENRSRTIQNTRKTSRQAPLDVILQSYTSRTCDNHTIQRFPLLVDVGSNSYFDGDIPSFLQLVDEVIVRDQKLQVYQVEGMLARYYFDPKKGLYYDEGMKIVAARKLKVELANRAVAFEQLNIKEFYNALKLDIPIPEPEPLSSTEFSGATIKNLLLKVAIPDFLQLCREASRKEVIENGAGIPAILNILHIAEAVPEDEVFLLQYISNALLRASGALIGKIRAQSRSTSSMEELRLLAFQHESENESMKMHESKMMALSEIAGVEGTGPQAQRQELVEDASILGIDLGRFFKQQRYDSGPAIMDKVDDMAVKLSKTENTIMKGFVVEVQKKNQSADAGSCKAILLRMAPLGFNAQTLTDILKNDKGGAFDPSQSQDDEADSVFSICEQSVIFLMKRAGLSESLAGNILSVVTKDGITLGRLYNLLNTKGIQPYKKRAEEGSDTRPEEELEAQINYVRELYLPKTVTLKPELFETEDIYRSGPIDVTLLDSVERAKSEGHTLDENSYVERHFTPSVMKFLTDNPSLDIEIYEGKTTQAFGDLVRLGYTQITPFSRNANTDFQQFMATNPVSNESSFVIVGFPGKSYQLEIAAHFMYYNPPVNPLRISHHVLKKEDASVDDFMPTLGLLPEVPCTQVIIQMGNVEEVKSHLKEKEIEPVKEVVAPNFYANVFVINGAMMVSLKIEPYLYADRSGSFLEAVKRKFTGKPITVIFTGTAGALDPAMKVGDIVAPKEIHQADDLTAKKVEITNHAHHLLSLPEYKAESGIFADGQQHGAVDTILFEDEVWFETHKSLAIVEQEVAHLAEAVKDTEIKLYAFFRISDVLHVQSFNEEKVRPVPRPTSSQGEIIIRILTDLLPDLVSGASTEVVEKRRAYDIKDDLILIRMEHHLLRFSSSVFNMLHEFDPKLEDSFKRQLNEIVVKGSCPGGDLGAKVEALKKKLEVLFKMYNLSVGILEHCQLSTAPKTRFVCKTDESVNSVCLIVQGDNYSLIKKSQGATITWEHEKENCLKGISCQFEIDGILQPAITLNNPKICMLDMTNKKKDKK